MFVQELFSEIRHLARLFYPFILVVVNGSRVSVDHFSFNLGREETAHTQISVKKEQTSIKLNEIITFFQSYVFFYFFLFLCCNRLYGIFSTRCV